MPQLGSIIGTFQKQESSFDKYEDLPHLSEYDFHKFYEENPNASLVIQGFVTMLHREQTGEPSIAYSMMFKIVDALKLKMFLFAFGEKVEYLKSVGDGQAAIEELWVKCLDLFGESQAVKKEAVSVALPGGMDQVRQMQQATRGDASGSSAPAGGSDEQRIDAAADALGLNDGDAS